jgi:hypothetical protein
MNECVHIANEEKFGKIINSCRPLTSILTSPAKKQQCCLSICFPNDICSKASRMCNISTMSDSHARGCCRRADSRRGILDLMDWNRASIVDWRRLNVVLRMEPHTVFIRRFTCSYNIKRNINCVEHREKR